MDNDIIDYDYDELSSLPALPALPDFSGGGLRFVAVSSCAILFAGGGYLAIAHGIAILAFMFFAAALCSLGYGGVLFYDWRIDRRDALQARADQLRFARERNYLSAQLALAESERRHIEALKLESSGRQSLYINGVLITAPLNHALPANVPHSYANRIEVHGGQPASGQAGATLQLEAAQELPKLVPLFPALSTLKARGLLDSRDLTLFLGTASTGAVVAATKDILMAAIVAGTGGGKSGFLRSLLAQWYTYYLDGQPVQFVLIDHDRRELPLWAKAKNLMQWVNPETGEVDTAFSDDSTRTCNLIAYLYEEMEKRARLPEDERERLPFVIVAIEEVIDVFGDVDAASRALLEKLMRRSRGVNFRVVCTAQYMRVSDVGKAVKSQSRSKFAGNLGDDADSARALGFDAKIVPTGYPGRFTFRLADGSTGTVQTPFISPAQVKAMLDQRGEGRTSPYATSPASNLALALSTGEQPTASAIIDDDDDIDIEEGFYTGDTLASFLEQVPTKETKEQAARRLWGEGFNSIRKLSDELTRLGYSGVSSNDSARALINRLGLR